MKKSLAGQIAIISGGLGDIGRAIAIELAMRGAAIAIGDLAPPAKAAPFLSRLRRSHKIRARYDRVDVGDEKAVHRWIKKVDADLGAPTLIIPNAAIVSLTSLNELTAEEWQRHLRVNLDGAFYLAQSAAQLLIERGSPGRIVFIGSWAGHRPHTHIPAYCVSKAALRMLCKCMALELAHSGILVSEVAPGLVDAGLSKRIWDQEPVRRERALQRVPIKKLIRAEDVAREVAHLCDPANQHQTGNVVLMDGGLSLLSS